MQATQQLPIPQNIIITKYIHSKSPKVKGNLCMLTQLRFLHAYTVYTYSTEREREISDLMNKEMFENMCLLTNQDYQWKRLI